MKITPKNYFYVVLFGLLLFFNKTVAQCDKLWSHYNHAKIHQMCFLTDQKWFMVGSFSTILVTENAGKTWEKVDVRDYFPFIDIDFFDNNEGLITRYAFMPFAVPTPACFERTIDGGKTWNLISTPFLPTQLFVTDSVKAYANSWNNKGAYVTTNRGKNWKKLKINLQEANSVYFPSKELGWAYTKSDILRTVDGGKNWEKYTAPSFLNNSINLPHPFVLSLDKTTLWCINIGTKTIGRSSDKGTTWTVSALPDISYQIIPFTNQKALFVYDGSIYETTDGGQTWKKNTSINGSASTNFFFLNEKKGYYVGSHTQVLGNPFGSNSRTIAETGDGGQSWKMLSESPNFLTMDMLNAKIGYAGSFSGGLFKTQDGGITWQSIYKKENNYFTKLKVFDENHFTAQSADGVFFTRDKGQTWQISPSNNYYPIDSLKWIRVSRGIDFTITEDGGTTYKPFKTPNTGGGFFIEEINYLENNTFVALAHPINANEVISHIYKTTDGGNTWRIVHSITMSYYTNAHRMYFKNAKVGFVVNTVNNTSFDIGKNALLRTIDGGNTWQEVKVKIPNFNATSFIFQAFDYYDDNNFSFFINGSESLCYSTKDGGNTWIGTNSLHPYFKYKQGYAIDYINKDSIFIAGSNESFFNLITPLQKPPPSVGLQGDTIVKLGDTTLHTLAIQINEDDNKWDLESGGIILGTHFDSVVIRWTKMGYHRLKVVGINSCGESTPSYFIIKVEDTTTLVNKIKTITSVFPNPTRGQLSIKVPQFKQVVSVEIRDLIGRKVYALNNLNWSSDIFEINLPEGTASGLYILVVQLADGKETHKIIVNN